MAISESTLNSDHRNHLTRRRALHGAACVGALALPAGVAMAAEHLGAQNGTLGADPGFAAIEAAIVANHHKWGRSESSAVWSRCSDRRMALLEEAAALPIRSDADAATALLIAVRLGDHDFDGDHEVWINTGAPEDAPRGNIVLSVQRYLAGRAAA